MTSDSDKTPRAMPTLTAADAELGDYPNCADDKPRVSDGEILMDLKYGRGTTNDERLALLDLRDARAALADASKELVGLKVGRGLLRRDARINKFNIAKAERERDDAIAHADDFGAEVDRLRAWVHDLQSGMYISCVYCGHRYGPKDKVPATAAETLKAHVERCPKHPMSHLHAKYNALRGALVYATEPTGAYSMDQFEHAKNVIEHMKKHATDALLKDDEGGDKEDAQSNADAGLVGTPTTPEIAVKPHRPAPSSDLGTESGGGGPDDKGMPEQSADDSPQKPAALSDYNGVDADTYPDKMSASDLPTGSNNLSDCSDIPTKSRDNRADRQACPGNCYLTDLYVIAEWDADNTNCVVRTCPVCSGSGYCEPHHNGGDQDE